MSSNINSNQLSINSFNYKSSPFEENKSLKDSVKESKLNNSSPVEESERDSVSMFNDNGTNSVNYDFSNFNHKNSIAEA